MSSRARNQRGDRFLEGIDSYYKLRNAPMPGDWAERTACREIKASSARIRVRMFFPNRGVMGVSDDLVALCGACPVLEQCREYALRWPVMGTWAGLSHDERVQWRKRERKAG